MSKQHERACRKLAIDDLASLGEAVSPSASYIEVAAKIVKHYNVLFDGELDAQLAKAIISRQFLRGFCKTPSLNRRPAA